MDHSKMFVGMSAMGAAFMLSTPEEAQIATFVLLGKYDEEIRLFLYWRDKGQLPQKPEEILVDQYTEQLEKLKSVIRLKINNIFNRAERQDQQERVLQRQALVHQMKQRSQPHRAGTVDELSKRYNVSKSQIRRLRTENRLDQFIDTMEAMKEGEGSV